jgi:hypothetical protein
LPTYPNLPAVSFNRRQFYEEVPNTIPDPVGERRPRYLSKRVRVHHVNDGVEGLAFAEAGYRVDELGGLVVPSQQSEEERLHELASPQPGDPIGIESGIG